MRLVVLAGAMLASLLASLAVPGAPTQSPCHEQYTSGADRLPATLDVGDMAKPAGRWTVKALVEVRRITDVALARRGGMAAFVVKQSFVDSGAIRYGLYAIDIARKAPARKMAEAPYMHGLAARPETASWTVLAEFGCGVQLYETAASNGVRPLLVNKEPVTVGGSDGVLPSPADGAHRIGVKTYQWAPNGRAFWYSRVRLKPASERQALAETGIAFDPPRVYIPFDEGAATVAGTELHIVRGGQDVPLAFAAAEESIGADSFSNASTTWSADSARIELFGTALQPNGQNEFSRSSIDAMSGERTPLPARQLSVMEMYFGMPLPDARGYLTVRPGADAGHLVDLDPSGAVARDYGPVPFSAIGGPLPAWWDSGGKSGILSARYRDRGGLVTFPGLREIIPSRDDGTAEHLETCDFAADLKLGICVRESLSLAPELVRVEPERGVTSVLVRPNLRIEPLRSVRMTWPNRFGTDGDGYVTYPRNYQPGAKLPVIVATHGSDAENRYAYDGFQWEYPLQVLAERGYLVLSVNEPAITPRKRVAMEAWAKLSSNVGTDQMQFAIAYEAVATMEAALAWAVDQGLADPDKAGIAGYSRGSHVVKFALSQSKLFKVGSAGDSSWFSASGYWLGISRNLYASVFGGSPFDPKALENYSKLSPSFRVKDFAGPLLQEYTTRSAYSGSELDVLLRDAGIPTDLVFYLDETHILWHPKRRASSMNLNLDWFSFWLQGLEDSVPEKAAQYARWRKQRDGWETRAAGGE